MANNIYIGNRYVPVFANPVEWDNLREYEPLTIVTYQGTAYTSKKTVPVGTALNNTEYWVVTGNYNAQVEQYRQEVVNMQNTVNDIEPKANRANTYINNEINNLKNVIVIGDSYGVNAGWSGWTNEFASIWTGGDVYKNAHGGAGWVNASEGYNFLQTLQEIESSVVNKQSITDIVVLGGYNDVASNTTDVAMANAMGAFKTYCNQKYPNAKITVGFIGFHGNDCSVEDKCIQYALTVYRSACAEVGFNYYHKFAYILLNRDYMYNVSGDANSYFHPNTDGCKVVAKRLKEYLATGGFVVRYGHASFGTFVYVEDGRVSLTPITNASTIFPLDLTGKTFPFNTWVEVADLFASAPTLWGSNGTPLFGEADIVDFDTKEIHRLTYRLSNNKLHFKNHTELSTIDPSTMSNNKGMSIAPVTMDVQIAY